ncbi:uncharacterized protein LOC143293033 isoform X2 [Babylonia areolata]
MEVRTTTRGKPLLRFEGYEYIRDKDERNRIYWKCVWYPQCHGRACCEKNDDGSYKPVRITARHGGPQHSNITGLAPVTYTQTEDGTRLLLFDGFSYSLEYKSGIKSYWACCQENCDGCALTMDTDGSETGPSLIDDHNHSTSLACFSCKISKKRKVRVTPSGTTTKCQLMDCNRYVHANCGFIDGRSKRIFCCKGHSQTHQTMNTGKGKEKISGDKEVTAPTQNRSVEHLDSANDHDNTVDDGVTTDGGSETEARASQGSAEESENQENREPDMASSVTSDEASNFNQTDRETDSDSSDSPTLQAETTAGSSTRGETQAPVVRPVKRKGAGSKTCKAKDKTKAKSTAHSETDSISLPILHPTKRKYCTARKKQEETAGCTVAKTLRLSAVKANATRIEISKKTTQDLHRNQVSLSRVETLQYPVSHSSSDKSSKGQTPSALNSPAEAAVQIPNGHDLVPDSNSGGTSPGLQTASCDMGTGLGNPVGSDADHSGKSAGAEQDPVSTSSQVNGRKWTNRPSKNRTGDGEMEEEQGSSLSDLKREHLLLGIRKNVLLIEKTQREMTLIEERKKREKAEEQRKREQYDLHIVQMQNEAALMEAQHKLVMQKMQKEMTQIENKQRREDELHRITVDRLQQELKLMEQKREGEEDRRRRLEEQHKRSAEMYEREAEESRRRQAWYQNHTNQR